MPDQLRALGTAFAGYLQLFANCFVHNRTVRHLHGYCRRLLWDLPRKSIEPMALACGTAVRTLQEFLRDHVWDHLRVRDQWQQRLSQQPLFGVADSSVLQRYSTMGVRFCREIQAARFRCW